MIAYVEPAEFASSGEFFPGLYNVSTEDGQTFNDLTRGQILSLALREGWQVKLATDDNERGSE